MTLESASQDTPWDEERPALVAKNSFGSIDSHFAANFVNRLIYLLKSSAESNEENASMRDCCPSGEGRGMARGSTASL